MRESKGGITYVAILDMTFHELVYLWEETVKFK